MKLLSILELNFWKFNESLMGLNQAQCKRLLELEQKGHARLSYMLRIAARHNVLRCQHERSKGTYTQQYAQERYAGERVRVVASAKIGRKDKQRAS